MKYKKRFLIVLATIVVAVTLKAVPALPVLRKLSQPDGRQISVVLRGDEHVNFYETPDGYIVRESKNGYYCYVYEENDSLHISDIVVNDITERSGHEKDFLKGVNSQLVKTNLYKLSNSESGIKAPGLISKVFPTTGDIRGLVVLVQFQDVKFSQVVSAQMYNEIMNKKDYTGQYASGSVYDYFLDQSHGQLRLEFDVAGPVTVSKNRAYYGSAKETGSENVSDMIIEAVRLAKIEQPDLDFSRYDKNNDGEVDFIYVIYAGHGEAQGGPEEAVWPQASSLQYVSWDMYDGLYLGRYACSCELSGSEGSLIDGIGTFCHEFGHILGLPDLYDTFYSGFNGMGYWDVMDIGSYNNKSRTPAGYSAFEKFSLGWIEPVCLDTEPRNFVLQPNESVFLISDHDKNEYFLFENRQSNKWDCQLPGHGMLVSRIKYDRALWNSNRVNTSSAGFEHVKLIPANNNPIVNDSGNLFPGSMNKTEFSDNTNPAMLWNSGARVGKPLTNISLSDDGVLTFDYLGGKETSVESLSISAFKHWQSGNSVYIQNTEREEIRIYSLEGALLRISTESIITVPLMKGVYIIKSTNKVEKILVQ